MKRIAIAAAVTALTAIALGTGSAGARVLYDTELTLDWFCNPGSCPPNFSDADRWLILGHVRSPRSGCRAARKVSVYHATDDKFLGSDTSDSSGHWSLQAKWNGTDGFYARVATKKLSKTRRCRADRSPTVN